MKGLCLRCTTDTEDEKLKGHTFDGPSEVVPNILEYFVPIPDTEGKYELYGQKAAITSKLVIAFGKEGIVYKVELTTTDGKKALLAMKLPKGSILDETTVISEHNAVLTCPGIIPMKIGSYEGVSALFMPLADGDLSNLIGTLTHCQAENIINVLKNTLLYLSEIGVYYFDIKPQNIVYTHSTIYLTDMSSAVPWDGEYVATHPPPIDIMGDMHHGSYAILGYVNVHKDGIVDKELAMKIYTYQLSVLYCWLLTPDAGAPTYIKRYEKDTYYYAMLMNFIRQYNKVGECNKYSRTLMSLSEDRNLDHITPLNKF